MGVRKCALEIVVVNRDFWQGRSVFLTGHTGFKGSWLALWLHRAGAKVHGLSLAPPTQPSLFVEAGVESLMATSTLADVRDLAALQAAMVAARPDVVFHLAAQPLVRFSYADPLQTFAVNVLGTANVLESVRSCADVRAVVSVTTDKCYANQEWLWGYREQDPLGGHDPYSASKACAEHVTASYQRSFFAAAGVMAATARAGNVIGGGDWAADRLVPDALRSCDNARTLEIRYPGSIRPWQHVLEPLSGYVRLAEALRTDGASFAEAWNFGPSDDDARPVQWILERLTRRMPELRWVHAGGEHVHEAGFLKLDSSKARARLGWRPTWSLEQALDLTVDWHRQWRSSRAARAACFGQIELHDNDAVRAD